MRRPDWFILIEQWVPRKMGESGITFPFLIGALAHKAGQPATIQQAQYILDEIVRHPVEGYFVEISWCHDIFASVLNARKIDDPYRMSSDANIPRPSVNGNSIAFSLTLTSHYGTKNGQALLKQLLKDAAVPISTGCYSRTRNKRTLDFEYSGFLPWELEYVQHTIMV